jgi:hypothetical protein
MLPGVRPVVSARVSWVASKDDASLPTKQPFVKRFEGDIDLALAHARDTDTLASLRMFRKQTGCKPLSRKEERMFASAYVVSAHPDEVFETHLPGYENCVAQARTLSEAFTYCIEHTQRTAWLPPVSRVHQETVLRPLLLGAGFASSVVDEACSMRENTVALRDFLASHATPTQRWDFLHAVLNHTPVCLSVKTLALALMDAQSIEAGEKCYFPSYETLTHIQEEQHLHLLSGAIKKRVMAMHACEDSEHQDVGLLAQRFKQEIAELCHEMLRISPRKAPSYIEEALWETRRVVESISESQANHAWLLNPSFQLQQSNTSNNVAIHEHYWKGLHDGLHSTPMGCGRLKHQLTVLHKRLSTMAPPSCIGATPEQTRINAAERRAFINRLFALSTLDTASPEALLDIAAQCVQYTFEQLKDMVAVQRLEALEMAVRDLTMALKSGTPETCKDVLEAALQQAWHFFDLILLDQANIPYKKGDFTFKKAIIEDEREEIQRRGTPLTRTGFRYVLKDFPDHSTSYLCALLLSRICVENTEESFFPETFCWDVKAVQKAQSQLRNILKAEACVQSAHALMQQQGWACKTQDWDFFVQNMALMAQNPETPIADLLAYAEDFLKPYAAEKGVSVHLDDLYDVLYGRLFSSMSLHMASALHKGYPFQKTFHLQENINAVLKPLQPVYETQWMVHQELYTRLHQKSISEPLLHAFRERTPPESDDETGFLIEKQQRIGVLAACFTCVQSFIQKIPQGEKVSVPRQHTFQAWMDRYHLNDYVACGMPDSLLVETLVQAVSDFIEERGLRKTSLNLLAQQIRNILPKKLSFSMGLLKEILYASENFQELPADVQKNLMQHAEKRFAPFAWQSLDTLAEKSGLDKTLLEDFDTRLFFKEPQDIAYAAARACLDAFHQQGLPFSTHSYDLLCDALAALPAHVLQQNPRALSASLATPLAAFFLRMVTPGSTSEPFLPRIKKAFADTLASFDKSLWYLPVEERVTKVMGQWEALCRLRMVPVPHGDVRKHLESCLRSFSYDANTDALETLQRRCLETMEEPLKKASVFVAQQYMACGIQAVACLPEKNCFAPPAFIMRNIQTHLAAKGCTRETYPTLLSASQEHANISYEHLLTWAMELNVGFEEKLPLVQAIKDMHETCETSEKVLHPSVKTYYRSICDMLLEPHVHMPHGVLEALEDVVKAHVLECNMLLDRRFPREEPRQVYVPIAMKSGFEAA